MVNTLSLVKSSGGIDKTGHCIQLLNNASSIEELDLLCAIEGTTASEVFKKVADFFESDIFLFKPSDEDKKVVTLENYFKRKSGEISLQVDLLDSFCWIMKAVCSTDALNEDSLKLMFGKNSNTWKNQSSADYYNTITDFNS